ncbi:T9SS type A sorting domain-containing protein [Flavobacteriaceae bacterium GSB9]|nr:T9SS type A sorting domain-containing protein [Flavobacteriaceae bacterium GSB9]
MKKITSILVFMLLAALIPNKIEAQKNVLYVIQDGTNDEGNGSSVPGNDAITRMLESDANFTVSWVKIANADFTVTEMGTQAVGSNAISSPVDFTGFDLVIATESLASSNAIFKAGNPLHPDQLTIPAIYAKSYAFRGSSTALVTSSSAVTRTQELSMSVVDAASPIFSGIDVSGGSVEFFRTTSDDKGGIGPYAVDVVIDLEISSSTTLLASVPHITDNATSVGINYFPSGTQVGTTADGAFAQDAIAFPFNFGATRKMDGGNVTSEFLTVWRNAAYMLTGQTVPTTLHVNPDYDKYEIVEETTVYDFRDGSIIPNHTDGYVLQGSDEANAQPQTDRFKSADGRLDYRHAPGDNYHNAAYGLDMKNSSRVLLKPLGTSVVKVPLSQFSSLDFDFKMPNNNNKSWVKVNGNSSPDGTYQEILNATAADGQDLNEFITIEFFATVGNSQNLEFLASNVNGGSDIYLPYLEVTYEVLRKTPTKILYLNNANSSDEGGTISAPGNDAITRMLNSDENFEVTSGTIDGIGTITPSDLSPYDLIIIQEDVSSGSSAFKSSADGPLAPKNLTVPVIYCKSEAFRADKATVSTAAAIASNKSDISVTVPLANQDNPIFSGIDFTGGDDVRLFYTATNGNGTGTGNTALKVLNGLEMDPVAATLATTPEVIDPNSSIVINHIPSGTKLGTDAGDVSTQDIVVFAFGYGAQVRGDGRNMTSEALTIWRNAVYMLTGKEVPTNLYENGQAYKQILYVNQIGVGQGEGASAPGADPVINMFNADDNFFVTYVETPSDGSAIPDISGFDLVIAQETISSGAALFQPGGALGIKDVTTPIIYNKTWAFRDGRAVTDADASVEATQNVSVTATNKLHPLYNGIDFTGGDDIRIFKSATAQDDGSTGGNKAIDALINIDIAATIAGTANSLATVPEASDPSSSFVINYLPAGTQLGEAATDVLGVNAVALSFSYGATILGDGANITPEALTIWRNAAYMLIYGPAEVPTTLVENPAYMAPAKVLYVNQTGVGQGEGASAPGADPVINMLNADTNIEVSYVETPSDGSAIPDISGFDVVIAQETISSGAALFQPGGALGVKDVTTPIIYNKTWAFRDGRAVTDADASVEATQNVSVTATNTLHPLFSGIDFTGGDDIRIFKEATAQDDGSTGGNKAIDALINIDIAATIAGTANSLATVPEATDPSSSFVINYLPAGTQLGEAATDVLGVDAVALSFSYGATILGDGANISPEALTIWRNAVYMLAFGPTEVPTTLVENPAFTLSIDKAGEVSNVSSNVRAIGNRVYVSDVKSSTEINIYSMTGALVKTIKTNTNTDFNFSTGLWIATVKTVEGTKAVKLLVK